MRNYHIAVIPGDGIGHEVCQEGIRVIDASAEMLGKYQVSYETFPWGCEYYLQHGEMMPKDALKILATFEAIYFGAVGFPTVPDTVSLHGLLLPIRQGFEQYACIRPNLLLPGVPTPLKDKVVGDIDFIVVR
jgi:tartrate dehydrogenase/decarboxylase / D-malate dehydrogenase